MMILSRTRCGKFAARSFYHQSRAEWQIAPKGFEILKKVIDVVNTMILAAAGDDADRPATQHAADSLEKNFREASKNGLRLFLSLALGPTRSRIQKILATIFKPARESQIDQSKLLLHRSWRFHHGAV